MTAPIDTNPIYDSELLRRAKEAAERWDQRSAVRERRSAAVADGRFLDADSKSRLAQRVNHLVQDVRRATRGRPRRISPNLRMLVERSEPVAPAELSNELIMEAVVGARDFLSVEFLERGLQAARAVGRVLIKSGAGVRPHGTGFLVAPGLLMTNQHVLKTREFAAACVVELDYEQNFFGPPKQSQLFVLEPVRFFINDEALDYALVAVAPRSDRGSLIEDYGWLPLVSAQGKIAITGNDYINIIQHPLGREKEVALRENKVLDLRTGEEENAALMGPFIHYEADTEKGSSGSPVLNDQWEVVALHHSGVPAKNDEGQWLDKDGNVWRQDKQTLSDVQWIANEGIRVSSLVNSIEAAQVRDDERELLDRFLSAQPPSVLGVQTEAGEDGAESIAPAADSAGAAAGGAGRPAPDRISATPAADGSIIVNVPVRISLGAGGLAGAAAAPLAALVQPAAADEEALERMDPSVFADRRGFDRQFLGVKVPLPRIKKVPRFGRLLRVTDPARPEDEFELRYHHYSVLMNAARRLAYVSASNIDFDPGATVGRSEGAGSWRLDPRIAAGEQLGSAYYSNNDYDKGHLTRREDVAWGRDKAEAKVANQDSFFYTNAAPQHFKFNQSSAGAGLSLWGELENHITAQGEGQRTRLNVFNGPVFGTDDKKLRDALVPLLFYKIVIWRDGLEEPGAVGFLLEQTELVQTIAEEAIDVGVFSVRQRRIAEIEALLDIEFGPVSEWDRMAVADARESLDASGGALLETLADIRL